MVRTSGDDQWVERPHLLNRLDVAAAAGRLIVFDARPGCGSRTTIRSWLATHPDWEVAWDDARMPADSPDEVLRRGLRVLGHPSDGQSAGARTVLVVEYSPRLVERIDLLDVAQLAGERRDVTVVVCTGGRLGDSPSQRPDIEVVTGEDLAWDLQLATEALERQGLQMNEAQLARLLLLCAGSAGRVVACARLRTEYPGVTAERMYARWLHERLSRHGADRLLLTLEVLGEVPAELMPVLLEEAGSSEEALAELLIERVVELRASRVQEGDVVAVAAPHSVLALVRSLVPTRGRGSSALEVARVLAQRADPDSLQRLYWDALGGDTSVARQYARTLIGHADARAVETAADTRWLIADRADADPALVAACLLIECGRGADPSDFPEADSLLRLSAADIEALPHAEQAKIRAARTVLFAAADRPADAVREGELALSLLESSPWEQRLITPRLLNVVRVALLVAQVERLDFDAAEGHLRPVFAAPESNRWSVTIEAAAGAALFLATLRGDLSLANEADSLTRVREAFGARPSPLVLLGRYVDAMNARNLPQMAAISDVLRAGEQSSRAWDLLGSYAVKDMSFRVRAPESLAESVRDRNDLEPLPRAVALDLRARQLIEMGRPGLALRLLDGLESDPRHVFCFVALRARALLALGFPQAALRELAGCDDLEAHSMRTNWRVRVLRIVAMSRSGMPSVAQLAFDTLVADVPTRWWGGVINWARFPELVEHAERSGVPGTECAEWDDVLREPLTPREMQLLTLMRRDVSVQQLAAEQYVSHNTMKTHLRNVYRKLGAASRADAVDRAMRAGLYDAFRYLGD